jgi:hypothetical protein
LQSQSLEVFANVGRTVAASQLDETVCLELDMCNSFEGFGLGLSMEDFTKHVMTSG